MSLFKQFAAEFRQRSLRKSGLIRTVLQFKGKVPLESTKSDAAMKPGRVVSGSYPICDVNTTGLIVFDVELLRSLAALECPWSALSARDSFNEMFNLITEWAIKIYFPH